MRHEWEKAKQYYLAAGWRNGVSLLDVSVKFRIPYQSVRRRAAREQWHLIREWQAIDPTCTTVEEYKFYYKQ